MKGIMSMGDSICITISQMFSTLYSVIKGTKPHKPLNFPS